jgi:hypothetical protein
MKQTGGTCGAVITISKFTINSEQLSANLAGLTLQIIRLSLL